MQPQAPSLSCKRKRNECVLQLATNSLRSVRQKIFGKISGMIFLCNRRTFDNCVQRQLLGLPMTKWSLVRRCHRGTFLFLYDTDDKLLHGVYRATSDGALNLDPTAWGPSSGGGSRFPAQVRFTRHRTCHPLSEDEFRRVVKYNKRRHFELVLNEGQVKQLKRIFESKALCQDVTLEDLPSHEALSEWPQGKVLFSPETRLLLVGDGNFSFSLSLANGWADRGIRACCMVATSLDSEIELTQKYGTDSMLGRLNRLRILGVRVKHRVDACSLESVTPTSQPFDCIVFNFPHVMSEADPKALNRHRRLMHDFFASAGRVLAPNGLVHLSLIGKQASRWQMCQAAELAGFNLVHSVRFCRQKFPGYVSVSENSSRPFNLGCARTFIFSIRRRARQMQTIFTGRRSHEASVISHPSRVLRAGHCAPANNLSSGQYSSLQGQRTEQHRFQHAADARQVPARPMASLRYPALQPQLDSALPTRRDRRVTISYQQSLQRTPQGFVMANGRFDPPNFPRRDERWERSVPRHSGRWHHM